MADLALIDIDGVLANDEHRVEFALKRLYYEYFKPERMAADSPLQGGRDLIARLRADGVQIQYMTGRREDRRAVTTNWLVQHGFPVEPLHMRGRYESMPLANFKQSRIKTMIDSEIYDSIVLYDDDPEVIRVVQESFGEEYGHHCTWYTKKKAMIRKAIT